MAALLYVAQCQHIKVNNARCVSMGIISCLGLKETSGVLIFLEDKAELIIIDHL